MIRKLRALVTLGLGLGVATGAILAAGIAPAVATDNGTVTPKYATCTNAPEIKKWYGHDDEAALFANVTSTEKGLKFNGPSLAHRELTATLLKDLPAEADLTTTDVTGAEPLVKAKTDVPFSTLNWTAEGIWSSKILETDEGGQNHPVADPADLVGLFLTKTADPLDKYTADTKAVDLQIGYASDTGNVATVTKLVFAGKTYAFVCAKPQATPAASATGKPKPKPSVIKGPRATATPSMLPLTGPDSGGINPLVIILPLGTVLVAAGAAAVLLTRERRKGAHRA